LCVAQTETVIAGLAPHYHTTPDGDTFKQVIRLFQEQKEHLAFADLTEAEVAELIAGLAPHFQAVAKNADEGTAVLSIDKANTAHLEQPF
jgi:hypothetical protein